jgi:hypothetical protein
MPSGRPSAVRPSLPPRLQCPLSARAASAQRLCKDRRDVEVKLGDRDRVGVILTRPMTFEEFADCLAWWRKREENERSWNVPGAELVESILRHDTAITRKLI